MSHAHVEGRPVGGGLRSEQERRDDRVQDDVQAGDLDQLQLSEVVFEPGSPLDVDQPDDGQHESVGVEVAGVEDVRVEERPAEGVAADDVTCLDQLANTESEGHGDDQGHQDEHVDDVADDLLLQDQDIDWLLTHSDARYMRVDGELGHGSDRQGSGHQDPSGNLPPLAQLVEVEPLVLEANQVLMELEHI